MVKLIRCWHTSANYLCISAIENEAEGPTIFILSVVTTNHIYCMTFLKALFKMIQYLLPAVLRIPWQGEQTRESDIESQKSDRITNVISIRCMIKKLF